MSAEAIEVRLGAEHVDRDLVHAWLARSYWAEGLPREVFERSLEHSLCFSAFRAGVQIGFARVVTDRATFAWLCDVIVAEDAREAGVGKRLMEAIVARPELQGLRRLLLATRDAHGLYARYGFRPLPHPERWMTIHAPDIYRR